MNNIYSYRFGLILLTAFAAARMQAQEAYETSPLRNVADVVVEPLRKGPVYHVDGRVVSNGYLNLYGISSDYGFFDVHGDAELRTRLREIAAMAALDTFSKTKEFGAALKRSVKSPFMVLL